MFGLHHHLSGATMCGSSGTYSQPSARRGPREFDAGLRVVVAGGVCWRARGLTELPELCVARSTGLARQNITQLDASTALLPRVLAAAQLAVPSLIIGHKFGERQGGACEGG